MRKHYRQMTPHRPRHPSDASPRLLHTICSLFLLLVTIIATVPVARATEPAGPVFLTFFAVGRGDALLIRQPDICAVLIDAGPPGSGRIIGDYLAEKGISHLDRLIISHPHRDHFGGVLSLPVDLSIGQINDNGVVNNQERDFQSYRNRQTQHPAHPLKKGDTWQCGDVICTVLGPDPAKSPAPAINDTSLVLRLDIGSTSLLLPGDIESAGRQALDVRREQLDADILKVPHHGAGDRHLGEWLAGISPELSVISVGQGNGLGAPDEKTIAVIRQNSSETWRTDQQGELEISIDRQGWHHVQP